MRKNSDEYYLDIAKVVSTRSTCIKRQYGAIIVNDNGIIATGYNGSVHGDINCSDINECPRLNVPHNSGDYSLCRGIHAEQNALLIPSKNEMKDATLYLHASENGHDLIDVEPCPICKKLIINAGIKKVVTRGKIYEIKDNRLWL